MKSLLLIVPVGYPQPYSGLPYSTISFTSHSRTEVEATDECFAQAQILIFHRYE